MKLNLCMLLTKSTQCLTKVLITMMSLFMATAFAQLLLKSLWNGEGPMKYPKIMIPNLRKFCTERFIFIVRVSLSKTEWIDFTYYQEMVYWAFHFHGSGLNHLWLISTFRIIKKWRTEHFIFMVRVSITHDWFELFILPSFGVLSISFFWFGSQSLMIDLNFSYYQVFAYWAFHFHGLGLNQSFLYLPLNYSHRYSAQ